MKHFCVVCDTPLHRTQERYENYGNYCYTCNARANTRRKDAHTVAQDKPTKETLKLANTREALYEDLYRNVYKELHQHMEEQAMKELQERAIINYREPEI